MVSAPPTRKKRKIGRKVLLVTLLIGAVWFAAGHLDLQPGDWFAGVVEEAVEPEQGAHAPEQPEQEREERTEMVPDSASGEPGAFERWARAQIDSVFTVRNIRLTGTTCIPRDSLLAGVRPWIGSPMLDVDLYGIAAQLRENPRVRTARVWRRLPGTLEVKVQERREMALVLSEGTLHGIDLNLVALPQPRVGWPLDVPVITGYDGAVTPGDTLAGEALRRAVDWVRDASRRPRVQGWIAEVHLEGDGIAWIGGADGWRVKPGTHPVQAQVSALDVYLARETTRSGHGLVDLRFPGFLIVKQDS